MITIYRAFYFFTHERSSQRSVNVDVTLCLNTLYARKDSGKFNNQPKNMYVQRRICSEKLTKASLLLTEILIYFPLAIDR